MATTWLRRLRGLLGRAGLERGEGLYIAPAPAIHTWFMRFPIDAVFVDRELTVLRTAERVGPWRARACRGASAVIELHAGECRRLGVGVGAELELRMPGSRHTSGGQRPWVRAPVIRPGDGAPRSERR